MNILEAKIVKKIIKVLSEPLTKKSKMKSMKQWNIDTMTIPTKSYVLFWPYRIVRFDMDFHNENKAGILF